MYNNHLITHNSRLVVPLEAISLNILEGVWSQSDTLVMRAEEL